eukprot:496535-Rhodomonas_salina.4
MAYVRPATIQVARASMKGGEFTAHTGTTLPMSLFASSTRPSLSRTGCAICGTHVANVLSTVQRVFCAMFGTDAAYAATRRLGALRKDRAPTAMSGTDSGAYRSSQGGGGAYEGGR